MAAKRKQKRTKTPDTMGPSQWRLQHGDFTPPIREADPETGRPVQHRRAVDTLGMMLANGTITQEMHDAGATFRALFYVAALDGVTRSALLRQPGGGERCAFRAQPGRAASGGGCAECAGWARQRRRLLRLVCRWAGDVGARMGHAPGLGRTACAAASGAGDAGGHAQRAGGASRAGGAAEGGVRL